MDIQQISDELEIAALLRTYAYAVDNRDWALWRSLFTEDAVVDYTSAPHGVAGDRDTVADWLAESLGLLGMTQHYITDIDSEIDGDIARVRATFYNPMQLPGVAGLSFCGGYYHHELARVDGRWRSRRLVEENLWFDNNPFVPGASGVSDSQRPPDPRISELLDKQEITEALVNYTRGMDRIDVELARSVFHPDAVADYGDMFRGTGYEFVDFIAAVHPHLESHAHHLGGVAITVDGDTAGSEAYVVARLRSRAEDGTLSDTISHGRYVDEWERRDGVWRISHRRYLHTLDDTRPVVSPGFPPGGSRDREDPSYSVLRFNSSTESRTLTSCPR